ncbi:hypothetical protein DFR48_101619 [Ciceribacter lividus]|uniref:Uncharacterized protein n=1 Tax=Ciceribacter lividus TaxID=1197950 RepID=A0A6I7HS82_9HYPH|nr:hypothetical protein [Ciceribacter lividus]RCW28604.1 hypothetical protein DFR48_101619 [Ciceribacter lividus]
MRKIFCSAAIAAQLTMAFTSVAPHQTLAATAHVHKLHSAHFIVTALEKKGIKVIDLRRRAQVYFLHVSDNAGTEAIVAIDGYSAEIIGLMVLALGPGVVATSTGSRGNHFVDLSYSFGYEVEYSVYESYTVVTTEEISITEEYTEVTYEESEEVTYEEVEETVEADLDSGTAEDAAGDELADGNNDEVDAAAYDEVSDHAADEMGTDEAVDDGTDDAGDAGMDDAGDDGMDGAGADDGGSEVIEDGGDEG